MIYKLGVGWIKKTARSWRVNGGLEGSGLVGGGGY